MEVARHSRPNWIDWFPVQDRILDGVKLDSDAIVLVDVGGGRGLNLKTFGKRFPQSKGKLILEDLPAVIDNAKGIDQDITLRKHDFFKPQPIHSM